jgi:DNA-binding NarL/FixJ family response regulator
MSQGHTAAKPPFRSKSYLKLRFVMTPLSHPPDKRICVFVADVDRMSAALIADGLRLCQRRVQVVATTNTPAEAKRGIREHKPDIGLINVGLRDGPVPGYAVFRELIGFEGKTKAIMMIPGCERDLAIEALPEGARRFPPCPFTDTAVQMHPSLHKGQIWDQFREVQFA